MSLEHGVGALLTSWTRKLLGSSCIGPCKYCVQHSLSLISHVSSDWTKGSTSRSSQSEWKELVKLVKHDSWRRNVEFYQTYSILTYEYMTISLLLASVMEDIISFYTWMLPNFFSAHNSLPSLKIQLVSNPKTTVLFIYYYVFIRLTRIPW